MSKLSAADATFYLSVLEIYGLIIALIFGASVSTFSFPHGHYSHKFRAFVV